MEDEEEGGEVVGEDGGGKVGGGKWKGGESLKVFKGVLTTNF